MVVGALVLIGLLATGRSQYRTAEHELGKLANQERIEGDLEALVGRGDVNLRCGPVGVPNHAPVPLLALYLRTSPARIVSPEAGHIERGVYLDPASAWVEKEYILDTHDPHQAVVVPPGLHGSRSQPLVAGLPPLRVADRAPLVE